MTSDGVVPKDFEFAFVVVPRIGEIVELAGFERQDEWGLSPTRFKVEEVSHMGATLYEAGGQAPRIVIVVSAPEGASYA